MLFSVILGICVGAPLPQSTSNWAGWIIEKIIHPATLVGIPLICFCFVIGIVAASWSDDFDLGVRSLAGALLPFLTIMFLFIFQGSLLTALISYAGPEGFLASLAVGFTVPFLGRWDSDFAAPLAAFCFASVFSVLVFSYAAVRDARLFIFYYGFAIGILAHLMIVGLPGGGSVRTAQKRDKDEVLTLKPPRERS